MLPVHFLLEVWVFVWVCHKGILLYNIVYTHASAHLYCVRVFQYYFDSVIIIVIVVSINQRH